MRMANKCHQELTSCSCQHSRRRVCEICCDCNKNKVLVKTTHLNNEIHIMITTILILRNALSSLTIITYLDGSSRVRQPKGPWLQPISLQNVCLHRLENVSHLLKIHIILLGNVSQSRYSPLSTKCTLDLTGTQSTVKTQKQANKITVFILKISISIVILVDCSWKV